jgi:hypothetical protein
MKITAFWDIVPCSLVDVDRCFRGGCYLHNHSDDNGLVQQDYTEGCNFHVHKMFEYMYRYLGITIISQIYIHDKTKS